MCIILNTNQRTKNRFKNVAWYLRHLVIGWCTQAMMCLKPVGVWALRRQARSTDTLVNNVKGDNELVWVKGVSKIDCWVCYTGRGETNLGGKKDVRCFAFRVGMWESGLMRQLVGEIYLDGLWTFRTLYERVLRAMLLEMLFILTSAGHSLPLICWARILGKPSVDVVIWKKSLDLLVVCID